MSKSTSIFGDKFEWMKIAFLGTKGIPNNYGGFEQFAEYLSVRLVARGHRVTVYNPSFHSYEGSEFKGVQIERVFSPEKWMGGAANFLYDHLCLRHALRQDYDVIYEAGYHSVAASYKLLGIRKCLKPVIITNMDGLEWKRSKWNPLVQKLIQWLEKIAVRESPYLISDNPGIRQYYLDQFHRDSFFLPYGADPISNFDPSHLKPYDVLPGGYFILIARMEPENNVELILDGYAASGNPAPFLVIGNYGNRFGKHLFKKFSSKVRFLGGVYDKGVLDSLRHFSKAYLHGHSVGGTNPSLLEAMSCRCFILSHNNAFNRGVLEEHAVYFSSEEELAIQFNTMEALLETKGDTFKKENYRKIMETYNWDTITLRHENLFKSLMDKPHSSLL